MTAEDKLLVTVYDSIIDRVARQMSFSKELIMSAKKIWTSPIITSSVQNKLQWSGQTIMRSKRSGAGRGDILLGIIGVYLVYLLYASGFFTAAAWQDFNRRFYQNFIKDDRYMMLVDGLKSTVFMTSGATVIGVLVGLILSVIRVAYKGGVHIPVLNKFAETYITVLRGTPAMVQLLIWNFTIFSLS